MSLCVYLLGGALLATLPGEVFQLRWTHSAAKTEWREVWRVAPDGALILEEARINGTGAGMEPGEGAWSADGRQVWKPAVPPLPELILAASDYTAEHVLCAGDDCRALSVWTGGIRDAAVTLKGCGGGDIHGVSKRSSADIVRRNFQSLKPGFCGITVLSMDGAQGGYGG